MSFDKDYPNRKDWRRPYREVEAFEVTCRNHGPDVACNYCRGNRTIRFRRQCARHRARSRARRERHKLRINTYETYREMIACHT